MKRQLNGSSFDDADTLLSTVQYILDGLEKLTLIRVLMNV
jgi:hypothetical protein